LIAREEKAKAARRSARSAKEGSSDWENNVRNFHYVYLLQSLSPPQQIYTGRTDDLKQRLAEHNAGRVPHTSKFAPWEIRTVTAFKDQDRAVAFERYLKSGSGRSFLHRHF
jgi:predicted GIY-YIG superfamily endonuclease